jgi:hypothetical protein
LKRSKSVTKGSNSPDGKLVTNGDFVIPTYATPGIYQAAAPPPADLRLVRTDIAGFFGFTERGPVVNLDPSVNIDDRLKAAVKLTSWNDFRNIFGGFLGTSYLAYAVRGFFGCGGTTCYVVRVGTAASPSTSAVLPLPAAVTPRLLTYIAAAVAPGQKQIKLESSAVVSVGDLIAISDPDRGECLSVAAIDDDQTITVEPALLSGHLVGDMVYGVDGSSLQTSVAANAVDLQVVQAANFKKQDLVIIEGGGVSEVRVAVADPAGSTIHLSRGLQFAYASGSIIRKYSTAFVLSAYYAGAWGNRIRLEITPLDPGNAVTHFSLRLTVDQGKDPSQPLEEEFYPLLSLDPNDPPSSYIFAVLSNSQIVTVAAPSASPPPTTLLVGLGPLANNVAQLQGGDDGTEAGSVTTQDFKNALDLLGLVDEVAILCCPDAVGPPPQPPNSPLPTPEPPPSPCPGMLSPSAPAARPAPSAPSPRWPTQDIQNLMIAQCAEKQYRVAVLDTPPAPGVSFSGDQVTSLQPSGALSWLQSQTFNSQWTKFAAVYYPWLRVPDEMEFHGPSRTVPPSGHIAGAYASNDNQFGVQKPPANIELDFVTDVDLAVTDPQQGFLNSAGINAIRAFPGRGIRVWGARSISNDPIWRFIHTRRLLSMIEDSVEKASQWLVFQTNNADLRRMVTHSLNVFLNSIWLTGGLQGDVPTQGYFVKCDDTNNPQASIDAGRLVCQVGVAIAAPMEFIVFEISRSVEGAQIVEA